MGHRYQWVDAVFLEGCIGVGSHPCHRAARGQHRLGSIPVRCVSSRASRRPNSSRESSPISPPATPAASTAPAHRRSIGRKPNPRLPHLRPCPDCARGCTSDPLRLASRGGVRSIIFVPPLTYAGGVPEIRRLAHGTKRQAARFHGLMERLPGNLGADIMKPGFGRLRRLIFDSICLPACRNRVLAGMKKTLKTQCFQRHVLVSGVGFEPTTFRL